MPRKSQRNTRHVAELVQSASVPSLIQLSAVDTFAFLSTLDPSKPEPEARKALLDQLGAVRQDSLVVADREAVRLLELVRFRVERMLEHAHQELIYLEHPELSTYDASADAMTRLIWLRTKAPKLFDQVESIYLTHHFHGHKKFVGFTVRDGEQRDFVWSDEVEARLRTSVKQILELDDQAGKDCEVIHFEMEEGDVGNARRLHYLVVYHPGKMRTLRQMKDRQRDLFAYTPALEATLVYDPAENKVHVLSDKLGTARKLADRFALIGFDKPLSRQPVDAVAYELNMFRQRVDLSAARAGDARVVEAWVSTLVVTLGYSRHSVTLELKTFDDIWTACEQHFGHHNPLSGCREVLQVKLCFMVQLDGETEARALDVVVDSRGSSNLFSLQDARLRSCGEAILISLGVMTPVRPAQVGADIAIFRAEMKLLDLGLQEVDGHLLAALGLPVADLVSKGLLKKKTPGDFITVVVDDEDGQTAYRRLKVSYGSSSIWADDEIAGTRIALSEGEACRYAADRSYLEERLTDLLRPQLMDVPLTQEEHEPYMLGKVMLGGEQLPVALVTRLWDARHADKADLALRQLAPGLTVVLTTTTTPPRRLLGPGIVISIDNLMQADGTRAAVDLTKVSGEIWRYGRQAEAIDEPRLLIHDSRSATLVGPWPQSWNLTRREWVQVVKVLVDAWKPPRRALTLAKIEEAAGTTMRSMGEYFRQAPEWTTYIRGADGKVKSRTWELRIGPDPRGTD